MPTNNSDSPKQKHYYYVAETECTPLSPSLREDMIRLYGLLPVAQSLARTNPDGSKGVKLRKSYKNHIADLPGKYTIPTERTLSSIVCAPENPDMPPPPIKQLDVGHLERLFNFEKSSVNGIPGFDSSQLAIETGDTTRAVPKKRRTNADKADAKRRHVKVRFD